MIGIISWVVLCLVTIQSDISVAQLAGPSRLEPGESSLRGPETSGTYRHRPTRAHFVAKPGSVIVHFDRNHDIQQLQYVMQDGRLANLYQRQPNHPANTQTPIPVDVDGSHERAASESLPIIDHDQTIEVIDNKRRAKLMLVGNHLTVPLPHHELEGTSPGQKHRHQIVQTDAEDPLDDKLDILATVAVDALQAGSELAELKLKKAGVLLSKLKKKVTAKLHELPDIIESNLRAKSSVGQIFLDEAGHKFMLVEDELDDTENSGRPSSDTKELGSKQASPKQEVAVKSQQQVAGRAMGPARPVPLGWG